MNVSLSSFVTSYNGINLVVEKTLPTNSLSGLLDMAHQICSVKWNLIQGVRISGSPDASVLAACLLTYPFKENQASLIKKKKK